ncbi:MAG: hypothetical protein ACP5IZ_00265 [Thermoprotei archaeon]
MMYGKDDIITLFSLLIIITITLRWIIQYITFLSYTFYQWLIISFAIVILIIVILKLLNKNKLHEYAKKHSLILRTYNKNQYVFSVNKLSMLTNNIQPSDENLLQLSSQLLTFQLLFSLIIVPTNDNAELYLIVSKPVKNRSDIDNFIDQLSSIKAVFHAYLGYVITNEHEKVMKNGLPIPF